MDTYRLKLIAIITMLIDHIGAIFIPYNTPMYMIFRSIGRLAFPIFAFLIVEGFYHTKNVKKYLLRLGIFALISEIPFDLAFYGYLWRRDIMSDLNTVFRLISQGKSGHELSYFTNIVLSLLFRQQNVFFTLFLGLLLITLMNRVESYFKNKSVFVSFILNILLIFIFCYAALLLRSDYDYAGILTIAAFYILRGNNILIGAALLFIFGYVLGQGQITVSILAVLSIFAIAFYNGKKGKDIKFLFYAFYPAHLLLLFLISVLF